MEVCIHFCVILPQEKEHFPVTYKKFYVLFLKTFLQKKIIQQCFKENPK